MNGIHEVAGSTPVGSTIPSDHKPRIRIFLRENYFFLPILPLGYEHSVSRLPQGFGIDTEISVKSRESRAQGFAQKRLFVRFTCPLNEFLDYKSHVVGLRGGVVGRVSVGASEPV